MWISHCINVPFYELQIKNKYSLKVRKKSTVNLETGSKLTALLLFQF